MIKNKEILSVFFDNFISSIGEDSELFQKTKMKIMTLLKDCYTPC